MDSKHLKKYIIIGGHLTPAIAILEELQKKGENTITWVGRKYTQTFSKSISAEYKIVSKFENIKFIHLSGGKIWRRWTINTFFKGIINLLLIPYGFIQAFFIILQYKPDVIISFGGYVALPMAIIGKLLKKKVVTHEQTLVSGLANKLIAKVADKIFISWQQSSQNYPKSKTIFTGNPVSKNLFFVNSNIINFDNALPILYITGGNQGSNHINKRIIPVLHKLLKTFNIVHQTGNSTLTQDYEWALSKKKILAKKIQNRYIVKDYIYQNEIGEVFNKADLVLSRAGANTCVDLLCLNKRAILIPIPWSYDDEQTKNAKLLENIGLAKVHIQDDSMTPEGMYDLIMSTVPYLQNNIGFDNSTLEVLSQKSQKLVKKDASKLIVDEITKLLD